MIVRRKADDPEACANCGEKIGKLETPHIWNQHIVCATCYSRLLAANASPSVPHAMAATVPAHYSDHLSLHRRICLAGGLLVGIIGLGIVATTADAPDIPEAVADCKFGVILCWFSGLLLLVWLVLLIAHWIMRANWKNQH